MEVVDCRTAGCDSRDFEGPEKSRYRCKQCGGIFLARKPDEGQDDVEGRSSGGPIVVGLPECYANFDLACSICTQTCGKREDCQKYSPPSDAEYYAFAGDDEPDAAPSEAESSFFKQVMRAGLIKDWPRYLKTLTMVVWSGDAFFSGAFSSDARHFHRETNTLDPAKFLVFHLSVVGLLTLAWNQVTGTGSSLDDSWAWLYGSAVDFLSLVLWMYVPAFGLVLFLRVDNLQIKVVRDVVLTSESAISVNALMKVFAYLTSVEVLALPLIASIDNRWLREDYFVPALVLALTGRVVSQFWMFPKAVRYACRVCRSSAVMAVTFFYVAGMFIGSWLA